MTPRDKKFFEHLGVFHINSDDDPHLEQFDNHLALVSLSRKNHNHRPTFQALCTNGFRYQLYNPS